MCAQKAKVAVMCKFLVMVYFLSLSHEAFNMARFCGRTRLATPILAPIPRMLEMIADRALGSANGSGDRDVCMSQFSQILNRHD